jgi:hypothetical protein
VLSQIIDDIASEFGGTPANVGDMQPSEIAALFDATYMQLGAVSTSLLQTLLSTKMPAGFGFAQAGSYLAAKVLAFLAVVSCSVICAEANA